MRQLTLDDLVPLDEYTAQRREFFEAHHRYLDRYRRVRIGPSLTLVFENRQTLWFRVQEVLRIARLSEPVRVRQELDVYNRLLPSRDRLQAALLIEVAEEARPSEALAFWQKLKGEELTLQIGDRELPSVLVTCRPEDFCIGAAHWVQFPIDAANRELLIDFRRPASFIVQHGDYRHPSGPLSDEMRQSLFEDLQMSDKD